MYAVLLYRTGFESEGLTSDSVRPAFTHWRTLQSIISTHSDCTAYLELLFGCVGRKLRELAELGLAFHNAHALTSEISSDVLKSHSVCVLDRVMQKPCHKDILQRRTGKN
jgi:hypothetical protein